MRKALLISSLFFAGVVASAHSALAETDAPDTPKKGPLGGLLEPWDGTGSDDITPKTIHLGSILHPWHSADGDTAKETASTAQPSPKKKGPLGGLLQPWGDKQDD